MFILVKNCSSFSSSSSRSSDLNDSLESSFSASSVFVSSTTLHDPHIPQATQLGKEFSYNTKCDGLTGFSGSLTVTSASSARISGIEK